VGFAIVYPKIRKAKFLVFKEIKSIIITTFIGKLIGFQRKAASFKAISKSSSSLFRRKKT